MSKTGDQNLQARRKRSIALDRGDSNSKSQIAKGGKARPSSHFFTIRNEVVFAVVPGTRCIENAEAIVEEVKGRVDPNVPLVLTSDEYPAYESAIEGTFGVPVPASGGPGRPRIVPKRVLAEGLTWAAVRKDRQGQRVIAVDQRLVFGTAGTKNLDGSFG